ncbi:hypothetical protein NN561_010022 [Cricetulus griseus]
MGPGRARPRRPGPPARTDGSPERSCPAGARSHNRRSVRNAPGWAGPGHTCAAQMVSPAAAGTRSPTGAAEAGAKPGVIDLGGEGPRPARSLHLA